MTKRKPATPAKLPQPAKGGSYIRDKDGTLARAATPAGPGASAGAATETPSEE